jgi:hypothetical protein
VRLCAKKFAAKAAGFEAGGMLFRLVPFSFSVTK